MISHFLFPNRFKIIGWILLAPSLILGILNLHFEYEIDLVTFQIRESSALFVPSSQNFTDEIAAVGFMLSMVFIGFSRLKEEDEYTMKIRLDSMLWSIYVNFALIFFAILFTYEDVFFYVMIYNLYTPLIIFNLRFHYYLGRR